jgi:hypothetical protein
MKRCPQCSFLYLDTDEVCDLDGSPLVQVNDAEVEGATAPIPAAVSTTSQKAGSGKSLLFTAVGGLLLGVLIVVGYFAMSRRRAPQPQPPQPVAQVVTTPSQLEPLASESATPTPEPSPSLAERSSPSPTPRTIGAGISNNPVSTTANQKGAGPVVIRLSNGTRIEADEAWRTKEGVWYRRSGMVTLLSTSRVKSIERGGGK